MPWTPKPYPNDSRSLYPQSIINKNKIFHTVKNLKRHRRKPKVTRHLGRSVLWEASSNPHITTKTILQNLSNTRTQISRRYSSKHYPRGLFMDSDHSSNTGTHKLI